MASKLFKHIPSLSDNSSAFNLKGATDIIFVIIIQLMLLGFYIVVFYN
jgi:hypothetical protein